MPDQLIAVVIGGVIASASGFAGQYMSDRRQAKRDERAHALATQDAKRERLRTAYKRVLAGAQEYRRLAFLYLAVLARPSQGTSEPLVARIPTLPWGAEQTTKVIEHALSALAVETVAEDVTTAFKELRDLFDVIVQWLVQHTAESPNLSEADKLAEQKRVTEYVDALTKAIQRHLKELE